LKNLRLGIQTGVAKKKGGGNVSSESHCFFTSGRSEIRSDMRCLYKKEEHKPFWCGALQE
jgi:hypothetical protein